MRKRKIVTIISITAVIIAVVIGSLITTLLRMGIHNNDYIAFAAYTLFFAIVLISIYRRSRIRKERVKLNQEEIKDQKDKTKGVNISIDKLPSSLKPYVDLFEKWGISNSILRDELYEKSTKEDLFNLKEIEAIYDELKMFVSNDGNENIEEMKAVKLTLEAYKDMGLWTWNAVRSN